MPSDQQVTSRMILQTILKLQRQGTTAALEHLEQVEPDLASYLMETLSELHFLLSGLGAPPKRTRRLYRRLQTLALVCVLALRQGHYELWQRNEAPIDDERTGTGDDDGDQDGDEDDQPLGGTPIEPTDGGDADDPGRRHGNH